MGIEPILLGGMSPTSVTTAVIQVGGVRSYRGFKTSRFGADVVLGRRGGAERCDGTVHSKRTA